MNSGIVPAEHEFRITFAVPHPDSIRASTYALTDVTTGELFFDTGRDLIGQGIGPTGAGLLPIVATPQLPSVDVQRTGFRPGGATDAEPRSYFTGVAPNRRVTGYPDDITVEFSDTVLDTSVAYGARYPLALPAKFRVVAHGTAGDFRLDFRFRDPDLDGTLGVYGDEIDIVTYLPEAPTIPVSIWRIDFESAATAATVPPTAGDFFDLYLTRPFSDDDVFAFATHAEGIDATAAGAAFQPYVVPNPYVGSASFEPERYAVSGRGERRIEFRGLPAQCTIRIYTVRGELVQLLRHDGTYDGYEPWDLRTRDNLDVAPGLYIFHVDGGALGSRTGKFALIK